MTLKLHFRHYYPFEDAHIHAKRIARLYLRSFNATCPSVTLDDHTVHFTGTWLGLTFVGTIEVRKGKFVFEMDLPLYAKAYKKRWRARAEEIFNENSRRD